MRGQEYLRSEKEHYGKIFVDINYAIDNVSPFLKEKDLNDRKYVSRLGVLKRYMELLESAVRDESRSGFLNFFGGDKNRDLLERYKRDSREELNQLEKCSGCACLNCTADCRFDGCLGCRKGAHVAKCDHQNISVIFHDSFMVDLVNERTGKEEKYVVLATLQNPLKDIRYIIVEGINSGDKFILYYYPGIVEDKYGEITDEEEFDFIVSTYESVDR